MVRRTHLAVSMLVLVALLVVPLLETLSLRLATPAAAQSIPPPSILVIQTDDMRADDLKAMPKTRNLLQAGGMTFTNYMSGGTPLCCPNRSTALTGQYPHNHQVLRNGGGDNGGHRAFVVHGGEQNTIATRLNEDYVTALLGKYMNGYPSGTLDVPVGWDYWHALIQDEKQPDKGYYYDYKLNNNGNQKKYGSKNKDYSTNVLQRQAFNIIFDNRDEGEPLFIYVNARAPHGPPVPATQDKGKKVPGQFRTPAFNAKGAGKLPSIRKLPKLSKALKNSLQTKSDQRRRTLRSVDRMVATLYAAMPGNSYVFFVSDNGYLLGEFRISSGKSLPYKASAEVPLLVAHKPAEGQELRIPRGATYDGVTSSIDLAPTWAAIAGTQMSNNPDGLSLLGVLRDNGQLNRDSILLEFVGSTAASLEADLDGDTLPPSLIGDKLQPGDGQRQAEEKPKQKSDKKKKKSANKAKQGKKSKKKIKKKGKKGRGGKQSRNTGVLQPYDALRGDDWLYIRWSNGHEEYYNHTTDPYELKNIFGTLSPETQSALRDRLGEMANCDGGECTRNGLNPNQ